MPPTGRRKHRPAWQRRTCRARQDSARPTHPFPPAPSIFSETSLYTLLFRTVRCLAPSSSSPSESAAVEIETSCRRRRLKPRVPVPLRTSLKSHDDLDLRGTTHWESTPSALPPSLRCVDAEMDVSVGSGPSPAASFSDPVSPSNPLSSLALPAPLVREGARRVDELALRSTQRPLAFPRSLQSRIY